MITVAMPVTEHTIQNGCLKVLRGSHLAGRITHLTVGEQQGADPERLPYILRDYEEVTLECSLGDVYFFHCNLFHASQPNTTTKARGTLLTCYNARSNNPIREHHHRCYNPLDRWDEGALSELLSKGYSEQDGSEANDPDSEVYNEKS